MTLSSRGTSSLKTRFQLFGDSINTAARINTSGVGGSVHLSQDTADLLISAGHSKWILRRRDLVNTATGKGVTRTYWLQLPNRGESSHGSMSHSSHSSGILFDSMFDGSVSYAEGNDEDYPDAPILDTGGSCITSTKSPRCPRVVLNFQWNNC